MSGHEGLRVQVLGGFHLFWGDVALPPLVARQARSLFAYLILNPKTRHTREKLVGTFWPDLDESRGRRRLSQALWQIQSALAEMAPTENILRDGLRHDRNAIWPQRGC